MVCPFFNANIRKNKVGTKSQFWHANVEARSPAMVRRIYCLIKMGTNFLLCVYWHYSVGIFETYTPNFLIPKVPVFRYLLALQDSAKYSVINTSTLGKLSELSDSVFCKRRASDDERGKTYWRSGILIKKSLKIFPWLAIKSNMCYYNYLECYKNLLPKGVC